MKTIETIIATTRVDRHGDLFTKEALESCVEQLRKGYIPMLFNHDPRIPPLGRTLEAEVRALPDGNHALVAVSEVFEPGDDIPLSGDREILLRPFDEDKINVVYDRTYASEEDLEILSEIDRLPEVTIERFEKKALEPLSALLIVLAGGASAFMSGFLGKMGGDAWDYLKPRVAELLNRRRNENREHLFILELQVLRDSGLLSVQIILTDPTAEEIDDFWSHSVAILHRQLPALIQLGPDVRRVVLHYANGSIVPGFAVRKDCVPLSLQPPQPTDEGEE